VCFIWKELASFALGNDRFVVVDVFNGNVQVHIRQYEKDDKGKLFPTKSGICLTATRFAALIYCADLVKPLLEKIRNKENGISIRLHLGGGIFLSANSDFSAVNVRRYFVPEGQTVPYPTKKGLALRFSEWNILVEKFMDISKLLDNDNMPCFLREDHQLLSIANACNECNPFLPFRVDDYGI